jgi:hypothetical protein
VSDRDSVGEPVSQVDTYEIVYCLKFTVSRLYPKTDTYLRDALTHADIIIIY